MSLAVGLALAAAVLFGAGTALQAQAASTVRPAAVVHAASLAAMVARPLWLAGTVLDWLGALTHLVALHFGPLTVVQPLTLTALVFAVPVEALLRRRRPTRRQLVAAIQTAAGLAVLALALGAHLSTTGTGLGPVAAGTAAVAVGAAVLGAARTGSPRVQALLLGAAAGTAYGLSDALFRVVLAPGTMPAGHPAWLAAGAGALVAGGTGLVLTQAALQKGRLSCSMPTQDLLALTVSIGLGAALIGEVPRLGRTGLAVVLVAGIAVAHGIGRLVAEEVASPQLVTSLPLNRAQEADQNTAA